MIWKPSSQLPRPCCREKRPYRHQPPKWRVTLGFLLAPFGPGLFVGACFHFPNGKIASFADVFPFVTMFAMPASLLLGVLVHAMFQAWDLRGLLWHLAGGGLVGVAYAWMWTLLIGGFTVTAALGQGVLYLGLIGGGLGMLGATIFWLIAHASYAACSARWRRNCF